MPMTREELLHAPGLWVCALGVRCLRACSDDDGEYGYGGTGGRGGSPQGTEVALVASHTPELQVRAADVNAGAARTYATSNVGGHTAGCRPGRSPS